MNYFSTKFNIISFVILITFFPSMVIAQTLDQACSSTGYTIATVNGMFTDKNKAVANRDSLKFYFDENYKEEKLTIDFLLNSTHFNGAGEALKVAIQKSFENETVKDYDLAQMFIDASQKVKTQKLLLVAHSQGNFYANSFYDVAVKESRIRPQSVGVYSIATPANHVAGGGRWLTSSTDDVIAGFVNHTAGGIMPPNTRISLYPNDDQSGHGFRDVYLKYRPGQIVEDIHWSLNKLHYDPLRNPNAPCITPPASLKYSLLFKTESGIFFVIDSILEFPPRLATAVKETAIYAANSTTNLFVAFVNIVADASSSIYAKVLLLTQGVDSISTNSNKASVILATIPMQDLPIANVTDNNAINIDATASVENQASIAGTQQQPQTVFVFEPRVQTVTDMPKLVFVGSFPGGSAGAQVMGTQSTAPVIEEVVILEEKIADNAGVAMATPALSAPQCSQTLATDGCLLSTTTVHFEWPDVAGADHYLLNKNGEYATTTEKSFDVEIKDFSDYIFEVVAVGTDGIRSATSTQAVSVATIPIAINEIAWMGTVASPNDEWFEIKNNTGHTIDLSQWELSAKNNSPRVVLKGTCAPHAYIIFERTDDTAVKNVIAHATTTGAFDNTKGDQLTLSKDSVIFDQTPDGVWVAGYNSTTSRQTMERYSSREPGDDPENWGTNLGYIKNGTDAKNNPIEGTPGEQNSVSTLINKGQDITSDFTLTADEERYVIPNTLRISASSTLTIEPGVEIKFYDGWINVHGHLAVAGTKENPVIIDTFSGNQEGGISVGGGYTDSGYRGVNASTTLDYVNIKNINYIKAYDNTRLDISNMDLLNSSGGIYAQDTAQISIASSSIRGTQDNHAVAVYENSQITIASSTITNTIDNDAVGVYNGTMTITNTTIDGATDNGGIFVSRGTLSIASSTIKNVSESGISLLRATSTISDVVIENAGWTGIEIYRGDTTIASTTISDITGWAGVYVGEGVLSISSSTIKNVAEYGIYTYKATSTISNVMVENGGINGVDIDQGTAMITDTNISGFTEGAGISVTNPTEIVQISGGEITGNATGIDVYPEDSAIITEVLVHDNGTSEADNVVVW